MRVWIVVLMVALLAVSIAAGAWAAQQKAAVQEQPAVDQPAEIVAGGIVILRLRVTVAGMTPAQRGGILYERLNQIISDRSIQPADVKAVKKGNDWLVMAGPRLFVTVTEGEAKANKTQPMKLAEVWASNLRIALPLARPEPVSAPAE